MLVSRQGLVTPVIFCLCILGVGLIQLPRLEKLLTGKQSASLETLEKDIESENLHLNLLKKLPSFGYDNFIADWTFINFLQYFGDDEVREKTGYSLSPEYFEVILTRDPRFLEAYINLSASTSLYAGMPERSIAIMEEGLKSLSPGIPEKSYYVWRYKAIDELLFLGNAQAAQESFTKAANWSSKFTDEESRNTAFLSQQTAEFLKRNPDSKSARISTWAMVLNNKIDEKTRKRAISEIEVLGGKVVQTPEGNSKIIFPPKD
ncbi:hypothetical protein Cylst_3359 [Cylindrospermum stagnale PCC 7417]|uniref:Tetratricopeptide repeat protein n=1 Tax=Cylindrospermum stagnale PCC 7417 TaxID=56107 RepID=K9X0D3_9NOST|nr:hypothetical protein [Cylindrospermum stagnale]AFZ25511.1 hypothetical protein Cylst_3359 [Cylindrospermum stagnale PCC 7417]